LVDGAAAIIKLLADFDKVGNGLEVLESEDQIAFQSTQNSMAKGGRFGRIIPGNFGSVL
jgi:hypothetical protein